MTSTTKNTTTTTSDRPSMDDTRSILTTSTDSITQAKESTSTNNTTSPSLTKKVWDKIKTKTKEHHQSVNAAYTLTYSHGQPLEGKQANMWRYERGEKKK